MVRMGDLLCFDPCIPPSRSSPISIGFPHARWNNEIAWYESDGGAWTDDPPAARSDVATRHGHILASGEDRAPGRAPPAGGAGRDRDRDRVPLRKRAPGEARSGLGDAPGRADRLF